MRALAEKTMTSLLHLFFPNRCAGCNNLLSRGEPVLCIHCLNDLPETGFHLLRDNPVEKIFIGRIPFHAATACYFFHKETAIQNIIHQFKYYKREDAARYMGNQMGRMLRQSVCYSVIDYIIPVPLFFRKEKRRGYNQANLLSEGIAEILHLPVIPDAVKRIHQTESQTRKSRIDRWQNVKTAFRVEKPDKLQGKHLLLVDDVITTGATLEAFAQTLLDVPDVQVSIAALAIATY